MYPATAKKLISKSSNFFVYTNVPQVENNRVCPICADEAPPGETHHPHYGGICCYSCRAFFRRAHQRTKIPRFQCKKDGTCDIVAKGKQLCKRCRYEKCKSVGMDPKWVLSPDEKRKRFEKFFKKKDEQQQETSETAATGSRKPRKKSSDGNAPGAKSRKRKRSIPQPNNMDNLSDSDPSQSGQSLQQMLGNDDDDGGDSSRDPDPRDENDSGLEQFSSQENAQSTSTSTFTQHKKKNPHPLKLRRSQGGSNSDEGDNLAYWHLKYVTDAAEKGLLETEIDAANDRIQSKWGVKSTASSTQTRSPHPYEQEDLPENSDSADEALGATINIKVEIDPIETYSASQESSRAERQPVEIKRENRFAYEPRSQGQSTFSQRRYQDQIQMDIGEMISSPQNQFKNNFDRKMNPKEEMRTNKLNIEPTEPTPNEWNDERMISSSPPLLINIKTNELVNQRNNTLREKVNVEASRAGPQYQFDSLFSNPISQWQTQHRGSQDCHRRSLSNETLEPTSDPRSECDENIQLKRHLPINPILKVQNHFSPQPLPHSDSDLNSVYAASKIIPLGDGKRPVRYPSPTQIYHLSHQLAKTASQRRMWATEPEIASNILDYDPRGFPVRQNGGLDPKYPEFYGSWDSRSQMRQNQSMSSIYGTRPSHSWVEDQAFMERPYQRSGNVPSKFYGYQGEAESHTRRENYPDYRLPTLSGHDEQLFHRVTHNSLNGPHQIEEAPFIMETPGGKYIIKKIDDDAIPSTRRYTQPSNKEESQPPPILPPTYRQEQSLDDPMMLPSLRDRVFPQLRRQFPPSNAHIRLPNPMQDGSCCDNPVASNQSKSDLRSLRVHRLIKRSEVSEDDAQLKREENIEVITVLDATHGGDDENETRNEQTSLEYSRGPKSPTAGKASGYLSHFVQVGSLLESYSLMCGRLKMDTIQIQDLIANHLRRRPLEKTTLISQLTMIAKMATQFATSLFLFKSLQREDQVLLLKNNIPLYVQYILARYFNAKTGMEQLSWVLEGQVPLTSIEDIQELRHISFQEYNTTVNFVPTADKAYHYMHLAHNIMVYYPFPENCNGLIVNLLLYYADDEMVKQLKEPKRISCIFDESKELVLKGYNFLDRQLGIEVTNNMGPLINTLIDMKEIFDTCCVPTYQSEMGRVLPKSVEICYTQTEESWLRNQCNQFKSEFRSVPPPNLYLQELVGVLGECKNVGETHIASWMMFTTERMRRVLKSHSEFYNLTMADQEALLNANLKSAVALNVARLNLLSTGRDQVKFALGYLENDCPDWENELTGVDLSKLHARRLNEDGVSLGMLDEKTITLFFELMKDMSELTVNDQLFQLFTFITLLDTEDFPNPASMGGIFNMRQTYLKLFQRKLVAAGCSYVDFTKFKEALQKLKSFGKMFGIVFGVN